MAQQQKRSGPSVVVIGAGIVGASIAFHLSLRDVPVTVIEGQRPGSGASGKAPYRAGLITPAGARRRPTAISGLALRTIQPLSRYHAGSSA